MSRQESEAARMKGEAALPRRNGELVFEEPWQSRIFGSTVAMHEASAFDWAEFQARLIEETAAAPDRPYYDRWLAALERLLVDRGLLSPPEIERRAGEYERQERDLLD